MQPALGWTGTSGGEWRQLHEDGNCVAWTNCSRSCTMCKPAHATQPSVCRHAVQCTAAACVRCAAGSAQPGYLQRTGEPSPLGSLAWLAASLAWCWRQDRCFIPHTCLRLPAVHAGRLGQRNRSDAGHACAAACAAFQLAAPANGSAGGGCAWAALLARCLQAFTCQASCLHASLYTLLLMQVCNWHTLSLQLLLGLAAPILLQTRTDVRAALAHAERQGIPANDRLHVTAGWTAMSPRPRRC